MPAPVAALAAHSCACELTGGDCEFTCTKLFGESRQKPSWRRAVTSGTCARELLANPESSRAQIHVVTGPQNPSWRPPRGLRGRARELIPVVRPPSSLRRAYAHIRQWLGLRAKSQPLILATKAVLLYITPHQIWGGCGVPHFPDLRICKSSGLNLSITHASGPSEKLTPAGPHSHFPEDDGVEACVAVGTVERNQHGVSTEPVQLSTRCLTLCGTGRRGSFRSSRPCPLP